MVGERRGGAHIVSGLSVHHQQLRTIQDDSRLSSLLNLFIGIISIPDTEVSGHYKVAYVKIKVAEAKHTHQIFSRLLHKDYHSSRKHTDPYSVPEHLASVA